MTFEDYIIDNGIDSKKYLKEARLNAKHYGLNPKYLHFSDDEKHKLVYEEREKPIYFGRNGYNDYILYRIYESKGLVPKDTAMEKRFNYLARATKIKGKWKDDPVSKNNLAINILW